MNTYFVFLCLRCIALHSACDHTNVLFWYVCESWSRFQWLLFPSFSRVFDYIKRDICLCWHAINLCLFPKLHLSCVPQYILMSWWNQYHVAWIKFPLTFSYWESRITYMMLSMMVTQCPTWGTSTIIGCLFWKNNIFDNSVKKSSDLIIDLSSIIIARWWFWRGQSILACYVVVSLSFSYILNTLNTVHYIMSYFNSWMYHT